MSGSGYARGVNRVALLESAAGPLPPPELVDTAAAAGFDAVGLHVAAVPAAERWWTKGAGSDVLGALIDRLLITRTAVLDVGRGCPWTRACAGSTSTRCTATFSTWANAWVPSSSPPGQPPPPPQPSCSHGWPS